VKAIEPINDGWRLTAGDLELVLDEQTGCLARLTILRGKPYEWTPYPGDVTVRDDRLERTFGKAHLARVTFTPGADRLTIRKEFQGAPWVLEEVYRVAGDALAWEATVTLDAGEYRSCAVSWQVPWPQPNYPVAFWAAKDGMPSAPHRHAGIALEYGEVTSGILIPALSCYVNKADAGLLLAMPFDFRTPRFRFVSGYRDPDLQAQFDWLALAPGRPARTSLLLRGTAGDWRPALGWLYERFTEYFEPRSPLIDRLWGGHICGRFDVSAEDAAAMAALGMTWHEIHAHYPAYGNYHPEGLDSWRSGHDRQNETLITVDMIRRTIATLHDHSIAALPYLQVSGDGDAELLGPEMTSCRIRNMQGEIWSAWPGTFLMNSDPSLPFGQDMVRQIEGLVARYPEMDGVFLDQPCYNFLDTAHDDGLTAVNNRPGYMTGFNYFPHLERLSGLLHPEKVIIGNGPFGVGILKYVDGVMAEGEGWLCDHLQYYSIGRKPLFFLMYKYDDVHIELMFQQALLYGAGFASYPAAMPSKDLFDAYRPVLQRLYRRRWVFDADPLQLPTGWQGQVYRGETGSLLVSLVGAIRRLSGRSIPDVSVQVKTADIAAVKQAILHRPGCPAEPLALGRETGGVQFSPPPDLVAGVVELEF
jgi:hypothetical protein